jgi:hypothetical protein
VSKDIRPILDGWDYDPEGFSVRLIAGEDGREKIQLRLDLGLLQMEVDGRPDGQKPEGFESYLDYYQHQQRAHDIQNPDGRPFRLDPTALARLLREGVQYYHRYLSFWHLGRYELCARDTARNLKLFSFVREHTENERDKLQFDQWRPYVTMMHARAVGTPLVELRDYDTALRVVDSAIESIWQFLDEYNQRSRAEQCTELAQLQRWRDQIAAKKAASSTRRGFDPIGQLREKLTMAVAEERFEEAAQIRDEIRRLEASRSGGPDRSTA